MVLTLYGNPIQLSTCTLRVVTILKEKQVAFQFKDIGVADVRVEEYADKMQPFRQIPYLMMTDFSYLVCFHFSVQGLIIEIHAESRAMARYIASKYTDSVSIEATQFNVAELLTYEIVFKPYEHIRLKRDISHEGGGPNERLVNRFKQQLKRKLDGYERISSKTKYLAGNVKQHVALADLFHLPYGEILTSQVLPGVLTSPSRPNVERWWKDIRARESWKALKDRYSP
ncbi:hypothetical protein M422DRAFT_58798 [Sphaerobolus stellatus SS14]|nr:hypothetical protein M422DRAFT_58798 [Sphaerobolus stellatus SS14]